jgi:HAMP domain-containing protein
VWVIALGVVVALAVVIALLVLWRAKRRVEYKYSSLLTSQPVEMNDAPDRMQGLPDDEERDGGSRGQL